MSLLLDDTPFWDKLNGVVQMIRNGLSVVDGLLTENILVSWAAEYKGRYDQIVQAGELTSMPLFEPFWSLLEQRGVSLNQQQKQTLYDDFWDN